MANLEQIIQERGLKKKFIAKNIGLSEAQFSQLLAGKTRMSAEVLIRLSDFLDVEPSEIYEPQPVEATA